MVYSSLRFQASPTGWGEVRELEFYNGDTKLTGTGVGSPSNNSSDTYAAAFDGNEGTEWNGPTMGTVNFVGLQNVTCNNSLRVAAFEIITQDQKSSESTDIGINIYPNPNAGKFDVSFYLAKSAKAEISIVDVKGRNWYSKKLVGIGNHKEQIILSDNASGVYLVVLRKEDGIEVKKTVVIK
ncbi:T9SS type A sorting domain-containing protein [Dyadobacter psychrotolerans]|uniref:T9SS type A sorting domain-containing protein n=1 Tax=Dyadobacter psychrotolerans TaxID=2541721 RepID=A0A4R5DE37_9BACT|nr:T9SS type A sorting domain-containing protein [Dyadobacter psychrotolerans]TDE12106.1 T9SS type A sorting domain-containing protein [Dyadobacter psychrotolerans]